MNAARDVANACLIALAASWGSAWAQDVDPERRLARQPGGTVSALDPIVVTATASERRASDTPASVSVIDGEDLRVRPVNDLADALRDVPGLSVDSVGLGRRGISIRGMSTEHTLILVDGQRVNTSSSAIAHSDFELGWVPTEAIERVEVVRGPMSSLYGSEALGGVINVITRTATDRWQGSASTYALVNDHGLDGNQYKTGLYLGGPLVPGRLGLNFWTEYRYRDALRDGANTTLTALDEQRAFIGHLGLTWTPDARQRIDVSATAGDEDQAGTNSNTAGRRYDTENEVKRRRYALSHAGRWDWGTSELRLYRSELDRVARRSDGQDVTGPNDFTDTVMDGKIGLNVGPAHKVMLGGESRRETLEDPSVNRSGKASQNHYALFAQDEIVLARQWELVLGGRFDHHEDFGWETSPRAYLLYHATDALTFKAGAGRGFKAPTLKQLSPDYESRAAMGGRGIIRGNPALQPETNRSIELGANYERDTWSAGATVFHNDVRNLIETLRQPTCNVRGFVCLAYDNVARARLQGVELTAGVKLAPALRLTGNYTYLDAQDRDNDQRLADRSRHRANATLNWTASDRITGRAQIEYIGAQFRSAAASERPGYTLLHTYLDIQLDRKLSLHLGIENITDKRLANDDASIYGRADEGRRYFAGLTARF
jgi:outer membrane receptor for ferrienterochelin and colicins